MRLITSLITVTLICTAIVCLAQWERRTVEVSDYYLDGAYATIIFDIDSDSGGSFTWEITYQRQRGGIDTRDSQNSWRVGDASVQGRILIGRDSKIHSVRVLRVDEN